MSLGLDESGSRQPLNYPVLTSLGLNNLEILWFDESWSTALGSLSLSLGLNDNQPIGLNDLGLETLNLVSLNSATSG